MTLRERYDDAFARAPKMFKGEVNTNTQDVQISGLRPCLASREKTPEYECWIKENFDRVRISPQIVHPDINDEAPLRRFMDLPKFLDLIVNQELLLPRLAELQRSDPYECYAKPDYNQMPREQLERYVMGRREFAPESFQNADTNFFGIYQTLGGTPDSFEDTIKKMSLDDLKQAAWFAEHSRLKQELVCSCWYGSEMDSDAMWRLYCESVGVSITTSVSRLKAAVTCFVPKVFAGDFKLSLAKIKYEDTAYCNSTSPWLIKRTAFRHEDEIRLYMDYPFTIAPGFRLSIDTYCLIEKVTVTPCAQKWQSDAIEATIKKLCHNLKIVQSTHLDVSNPSWPQSEGEKLAAALNKRMAETE